MCECPKSDQSKPNHEATVLPQAQPHYISPHEIDQVSSLQIIRQAGQFFQYQSGHSARSFTLTD